MSKTKWLKYYREYEWKQIFAMLRNNRKDPQIWEGSATGKFVVITGATSGIGYATARKYAAMGAELCLINRNKTKSEALIHELQNDFGVKHQDFIADLSKLSEINKVADHLASLPRPIDVIIHNAGVYLTKQEITEDNLDLMFVVHYLSSFIINYRLIEKLRSQSDGRIILVNSEGHRFAAWGLRLDDLNFTIRKYSGLKSYGSAKTAQLLSMLVFKEQFKDSGVTILGMHPGAVKSNTGQENGAVYKWLKQNFLERSLRPAEISAKALYYLGMAKEIGQISGKFFNLTTEEIPAPPALDLEVARELWQVSLALSNINQLASLENE